MLPKSKIERIFHENLRESCRNSPLETSPNYLPLAEEKCYFEFGIKWDKWPQVMKSLSFNLLLKQGLKQRWCINTSQGSLASYSIYTLIGCDSGENGGAT